MSGFPALTRQAANQLYTPGGAVFLNISDYATSKTVNTSTLNAAIAAAGTAKCRLYVPGGDPSAPWILDGAITLVANMDIEGDGSGSSNNTPRCVSKLQLANGVNASMFVMPDDARSVTFTGVLLDGNKANQSGTSHGIELSDGTAHDAWLTVMLCEIQNFLTDGIHQGLNRRGVNVWCSYVFSCGQHGVYLGSSDNSLLRAVIGLNTGDGVKIDTASVQHIESCDIFRNNIGIEAVGGAGTEAVHIHNTTCDRNGEEGIYLDVGSASVDQCYLNANATVTLGKSHINCKNLTTNVYSISNCTFDHTASDFPANQVAYNIFVSGTTAGIIDTHGNTYLANANTQGTSNAPNLLGLRIGAGQSALSIGQAASRVLVTGDYVTSVVGFRTTSTPTNQSEYVRPVPIPAAGTLVEIGCEVTTQGESRSVVDGVLNSTTTVTSATATFVAGDRGKLVTGTGIAAQTTIATVTNATTVELSQAATATAVGVSLTFASCIRLGVRADNGSGYPANSAPLVDAGVVTAVGTGYRSLVISLAVTPGRYWFSATTQGAPSVPPVVRADNGGCDPIVQTTGILACSTPVNSYRQTGVTNALPNTFNASKDPQGSGPVVVAKYG